MAIRVYSTPHSWNGSHKYRVEIHDTDFVGAEVFIPASNSGFFIEYEGEIKNRATKTICGAKFNIDLRLDTSNSDHLAFFNAIALQQEGRFFVKVLKHGKVNPGVYDHIFIGHLTVDAVTLQNSGNSILTIAAADGLFRLKGQEFKSDTIIPDYYGNDSYYYWGPVRILDIIFQCLEGLGTQDLYPASSFENEFLSIDFDWYESNHPNTAVSSLEYMRIFHEVFTQKDGEGNYLTTDRATVLKSILDFINCKIVYRYGTYFIISRNNEGKSSKVFFNYEKDGTFINKNGKANWFFTENTVNSFGEKVKVSGGRFGFLPPIKEVCVQLNYTLGSYGYTPNYWSTDEDTLVSIGEVEITSEETAIFCRWITEFKVVFDLLGYTNLQNRYVTLYFGLTIKFGSHYYVTNQEILQREDEDQNGNPITITYVQYTDEWSTTPGYFLYRTNPNRKIGDIWGIWSSDGHEMTTLPLLDINEVTPGEYNVGDIDTLSLKLEFVKMTYPDYDLKDIAGYTIEWKTRVFYMTPFDGERILKNEIGAKYCAEINSNNSTTIKVDTSIGDVGYNSNNKVEVYNGTDWIQSGQLWGVDSLAGDKKIQELLLSEIAAGQRSILRTYDGLIYGYYDPRFHFIYDGVTWIPTKMTHDLYLDLAQGEWVQYVYNVQAITITIDGIAGDSTGLNLSSSVFNPNNSNNSGQAVAIPFSFEGPLTELEFTPLGISIPDPDTVGVNGMMVLVHMDKEGYRMHYKDAGFNGYNADYGNNKFTLNRQLRAGETIRGYIIQNL